MTEQTDEDFSGNVTEDVRASAQRFVFLHELLRGSPHPLSCHCGNPQNGGATCADLQKAAQELQDSLNPQQAAVARVERAAFQEAVRAKRTVLSQALSNGPPLSTEESDVLDMFE